MHTYTYRRTTLLSIVFAFITLLLSFAPHAHAAVLTSTDDDITPIKNVETIAQTYDNGVVVFVVNFTLKALGGQARVPAIVSHDTSPQTVSYTIEDGDGNKVTDGFSAGMLISNSAKKDAQGYLLEKDVRHPFTLIAVYQNYTGTDEYRLRVTDMPLTFGDGTTAYLNASELKELMTDFAAISEL